MLSRLRTMPIGRAALTSAAVMSMGDVTCQCIQQRSSMKSLTIDWVRSYQWKMWTHAVPAPHGSMLGTS